MSPSMTPAEGAVLVIWNGQLNTGKKPRCTLSTESGSALTIVFTGTNGGYIHAPTGDGTLDFNAPTTGPWKGMAIYQDPNLTTGVDISEAGNSPTWKISGMVYLPHASVTFSGAISKSSNGESCFGMVVENLLINGTGEILATRWMRRGRTRPADRNCPNGPRRIGPLDEAFDARAGRSGSMSVNSIMGKTAVASRPAGVSGLSGMTIAAWLESSSRLLPEPCAFSCSTGLKWLVMLIR